MRGVLGAAELFVQRPIRIAPNEDGGAIAVAGDRQAPRGEDRLKDDRIPVQILGRAKVEGQDVAARVIDRAMQGQGRPGVPQPGRRTPVEEDQLPARAAGSRRRRCGGAWPRVFGRPPQRLADPTDRFPAHPSPSTPRASKSREDRSGRLDGAQQVHHAVPERPGRVAGGEGRPRDRWTRPPPPPPRNRGSSRCTCRTLRRSAAATCHSRAVPRPGLRPARSALPPRARSRGLRCSMGATLSPSS